MADIDECSRWVVHCAHCSSRCKSTKDVALHFVTQHLLNAYWDQSHPCRLCKNGEGVDHIKFAHPNVCVFCLVDASNGEHETCKESLADAFGFYGITMIGNFFKSRVHV